MQNAQPLAYFGLRTEAPVHIPERIVGKAAGRIGDERLGLFDQGPRSLAGRRSHIQTTKRRGLVAGARNARRRDQSSAMRPSVGRGANSPSNEARKRRSASVPNRASQRASMTDSRRLSRCARRPRAESRASFPRTRGFVSTIT